MFARPLSVALLVAPAACLAFASPAHAAVDPQAFSATQCEPYGPDTTRAELGYGPNGIYNGGTANEKVLCPLIRSHEGNYLQKLMQVEAHYRVLGGTPARMTCTLWMGSTSQQGSVQYSQTQSGALVNGGAYSMLAFVTLQPGDYNIYEPHNLICVIPPKTSFASIVMQEDTYVDP